MSRWLFVSVSMALLGASAAPVLAQADITTQSYAAPVDAWSGYKVRLAALEDATLSIRPGELMTLLGPSGCGKTTLLNLVAGFLVADTGEIEIAGKRVNDIPTYKREIGMMFQNYALFPHMNIADNVGYGLRMRGVVKPDLKRRVVQHLLEVERGQEEPGEHRCRPQNADDVRDAEVAVPEEPQRNQRRLHA